MAIEGERIYKSHIFHNQKRGAIGEAPIFIGIAYESFETPSVQFNRKRHNADSRIFFERFDESRRLIPNSDSTLRKIIQKFDNDEVARYKFIGIVKGMGECSRNIKSLIERRNESYPKTRIDKIPCHTGSFLG